MTSQNTSLFKASNRGKIRELTESGQPAEVLQSLEQRGICVDASTYKLLLRRCTHTRNLMEGRNVHLHIIKTGFKPDVYLLNALLNMFCKCGSLLEARKVFDTMQVRDMISWTLMLASNLVHMYVRCGSLVEARKVFDAMQERAAITWTFMLAGYAKQGLNQEAFKLYEQMAERNVVSWNALIAGSVQNGNYEEAFKVFDNMKVRDVISWSAMIEGYAEHGPYERALEVFQQMESHASVKPNTVTFIGLLKACANQASQQSARLVHTWIAAAGLESNIRVGNGLINMYAKCGSIKDAYNTFNTMPEKDLVTWSAMIVGLGQHGYAREALQLFHELISEGVKPDGVVFIGVLSACSHAGLVDEGLQYFFSMSRVHGISPGDEHFGCVVDLLGRAGHLDEAEDFVNKMPLSPGGATWGAVLGACRLHGNVKLAERAAEICFKLEPQNSAVYMSLSHVYATAGLWNKATSLRKLMKERGIKKEAGRSWIEVANKTHSFRSGDTAHPQIAEIWSELDNLTTEMEEAGYVPDTRWVMQDVDEHKSRQILRCHSEKLAIAFGLISTPPGSIIHIWKNLRICGDCHTASKFISKLRGREIIARDANRFHQFRDGMCSCGDYF
ncbi:unnamed protein product [Sphagnum jensenii]|uniref:DYW domain-containing protein n=1 Tax=Sphagnum jensenii TaxID=128206 RepID=A0ABP0VV29_9BRYO